ncbi:MAG TPA: magnesium-translocating P-type ATPase [Planctomycetota bacterium]|nr:magnesium-translocating P-type ATPase [Planctomycetota bacterium]
MISAAVKRILNQQRKGRPSISVNPLLIEASKSDADAIVKKLESSRNGLTTDEAAIRIEKFGENIVGQEHQQTWYGLLLHSILNPLVILLAVLGILSSLTGDIPSCVIMFTMVFLGVIIRFVQEKRADTAAAKLKAMISVTATALRDGAAVEIPLEKLVPGDVVKLAAGDMIPADLRVLACKDLFVIQSSLTGESLPIEKFDHRDEQADRPPLESPNVCFLGTSVERGTATAVVVASGSNTYLGGIARAITGQQIQTAFDKGINRFTWLMIAFMCVMTPTVFLIQGLFKQNWMEAFFFSMAVAVGLTPEMLPMIVTVCLSKGALAMSRKKVIVKRLNSIQNLGAMDVLCTDKTGTLTMDKVILEQHCDVAGKEDDDVLALAYLNSHFQTGLKNLLDRAVLEYKELHDTLKVSTYSKFDEIPFDFQRKMMSVVVEKPDGAHRLICKGATEEIYKRCTTFELNGKIFPIDNLLISTLREEYEDLSADGFRVLGIAYKDPPKKQSYSTADETELTLKGYIAFLDPPKESAMAALQALKNHGIAVKVLTGDNNLVSKKVCKEVGLPTDHILLGPAIETMTDAELSNAVEETTLFARLSPAHKQRIIQTLQQRKHVVGFLGDGINDAAALRAADVGVSVDTAVDIAKESADMILLEKNLLVLEEGVLEGRKVFANILKYIRMGASSNFGNMFSVLGASIFLPFEPMRPLQILTNNLLYDFSQVPIPSDDVDPEEIAKPRPWSMNLIARFIVLIGPCSSIFDYTTYFIMLYVFNCWNNASLFQTGWFVESLITQTLIIHIIRTNKIPFIQSRASWPLIVTSSIIIAIGAYLPFSPLAGYLGFTALPHLYWPLLLATLLCYVILTQIVKTWLVRKLLI